MIKKIMDETKYLHKLLKNQSKRIKYAPNLNVKRNKSLYNTKQIVMTSKKIAKLNKKSQSQKKKYSVFQTNGTFSEHFGQNIRGALKKKQNSNDTYVSNSQDLNTAPCYKWKEKEIISTVFHSDNIYTDKKLSLSVVKMPQIFPFIPAHIHGAKVTDLKDARIGTIFIRKSGAISTKIGNVNYFFDSFNACISQDVICIPEMRDGKADIVELGPILNNFVLSPELKI